MPDILLFRNFSKRYNSTKRPDLTTGHLRQCKFKALTSLEEPTLQVTRQSDADLDTNYVYMDGTYYYVRGKSIGNNDILELDCVHDLAATFKEFVLDTTAYIKRTAAGYDISVHDTLIPTKNKPYFKSVSVPIIDRQPLDTYGYVVVQAVSRVTSGYTQGTAAYAFKPAQGFGESFDLHSINAFMQIFMQKTGVGQAIDEALEQKLANTFSAVTKVTYIPALPYSMLQSAYPDVTVVLGDYEIPDTSVKGLALLSNPNAPEIGTYTKTITIALSSILNYPVGDYRNGDDMAQCYLHLPYIGEVKMPLSDYVNTGATNITIKVNIDYVTGEIKYTRYGVNGEILDIYRGQTGVDISLSQIATNPERIISSYMGLASSYGGAVSSMIGAVATGQNIAGAGQSALGLIGSTWEIYTAAKERQLTTAGKGANSVAIARDESINMEIIVTGNETTTEPTSVKDVIGLPLERVVKIGDLHSGFVQTASVSIDGPMLSGEREALNAMLNSGMYIE